MGACVVAVPAASPAPAAVPTIAECKQRALKTPTLRGSHAAALVACLRPTSIRMKATASWTTCPNAPVEEPCVEATVRVSFHSAKGLSVVGQESWGRENLPGAGIFALRGTGTYSCKAQEIDRQSGRSVIRSYAKTLPLRDAAAGFAVIGNKIKVSTSIDPGRHGPFGQNATARLGTPRTCERASLPSSLDAVRGLWPGALFSLASFRGPSTTSPSPAPSRGLCPRRRPRATRARDEARPPGDVVEHGCGRACLRSLTSAVAQ